MQRQTHHNRVTGAATLNRSRRRLLGTMAAVVPLREKLHYEDGTSSLTRLVIQISH
jgi:hypothetical protein